MTDRFYTSRAFLAFFAVLSAIGFATAAWLWSLGMRGAIPALMLLCGVVLGLNLATEASRPAIEVEGRRITMRHARLRAPFVIDVPAGRAFRVEPHLLGLRLAADGGEPWLAGRLREVALDDGRTLLVPTRQLGAKDRARLEVVLRALGDPAAGGTAAA